MVVVALGVLASCDTNRDGERVTACSLLAAADVARALGAPVSDPDATTDEGADALAGRSGCAWATTGGQAAVLVELLRTDDMSDVVRRTGFSAAARFGAARSRHPEAESTTVGGAAALWVEELGMLHVLAGGNYVTFEVAMSSAARARSTAMALATRAVSRLSTVAV